MSYMTIVNLLLLKTYLHWSCNVDEPPLFYFLFFFSQNTLDSSSVFFFMRQSTVIDTCFNHVKHDRIVL